MAVHSRFRVFSNVHYTEKSSMVRRDIIAHFPAASEYFHLILSKSVWTKRRNVSSFSSGVNVSCSFFSSFFLWLNNFLHCGGFDLFQAHLCVANLCRLLMLATDDEYEARFIFYFQFAGSSEKYHYATMELNIIRLNKYELHKLNSVQLPQIREKESGEEFYFSFCIVCGNCSRVGVKRGWR